MAAECVRNLKEKYLKYCPDDEHLQWLIVASTRLFFVFFCKDFSYHLSPGSIPRSHIYFTSRCQGSFISGVDLNPRIFTLSREGVNITMLGMVVPYIYPMACNRIHSKGIIQPPRQDRNYGYGVELS